MSISHRNIPSNSANPHMASYPGNPLNPHMARYQNRISSFRNWPYHIETSPEKFAAAGFFYLGQGDRLKCFYCNEGLQDWVDGEEPWFEHAKWSPR